MRWELLLLDYRGHPAPEAGSKRAAHSLGSPALVKSFLDDALADLVWTGDRRARVTAERVTLDLDLDGAPEVERIRVVAGSPEDGPEARREARGLVVHVCLVNGWAALDVAAASFLDLEEDDRAEQGLDP